MKNIVLLPEVITTATIRRTLILLDPYFEGETSMITSGLRPPEKQLSLIVEKVMEKKIDQLYPEFGEMNGSEFSRKVTIDGSELYWWQRSWSKLLNIGYVINPPTPAEALYDYFRPGSTFNKKGMIITSTPHAFGGAFDISGDGRIPQKIEIIKKAKEEGQCFIKNFLAETGENQAIHVDCISI